MPANGIQVIVFPLRRTLPLRLTPLQPAKVNFRFGGFYNPPVGDQASLTWEILPAGNGRAFGFEFSRFGAPTLVNNHVGWLATNFGTPLQISTVFVSGFTSTALGAPHLTSVGLHISSAPSTTFGTANVEPKATSIYSTVFGTPNSPYTQQTTDAAGIAGTVFGTPRLTSVCRTTASVPSTRIPTAYYAVNQTKTATGFVGTLFGTPGSMRRTFSGNVLCQAFGGTTTSFGTPNAARSQSAAATGFVVTTWGTPGSSGGYGRVTGFSRTRLGRPTAQSRLFARYASGFGGSILGTPTAAIRNRVASFDTVSRFGTPLLTRNTVC
jgi:hypothetical protein